MKISDETRAILENAFCVNMKDLEDACMTPTNKDELKRYIRANKNILKAEEEYYRRKFKMGVTEEYAKARKEITKLAVEEG